MKAEFRDSDFGSHRLPRELEAALREFGKWSDAQLLSEQTATTPTDPFITILVRVP